MEDEERIELDLDELIEAANDEWFDRNEQIVRGED